MKIHRIGVIGAGMIGRWHAEAIRQLRNAQLVGVCDHGSGKAGAFAPRCGCAVGVCDLERFIAQDDLGLITIGTPSGTHCEIAELAAKHGKHCIVEKPLDISLARIDRMIEAHERAGTTLGGFFNGRQRVVFEVQVYATHQGQAPGPYHPFQFTTNALVVPRKRPSEPERHGDGQLNRG